MHAVRSEAGFFRFQHMDMWYIWEHQTEDKRPEKPITFCWEGGPGDSSASLVVRSFGHSRVDQEQEKFVLRKNPYSLLSWTDRIIVDAPGTGRSALHSPSPDEEKAIFSAEGDAKIFADFIVKFLDKFQLWSRPIFLHGESYGGTRVCLVLPLLAEKGILCSGVILGSPLLNSVNTFQGGFSTPEYFVGLLPTQALLGWYWNGNVRRQFNHDVWLFLLYTFEISKRLLLTLTFQSEKRNPVDWHEMAYLLEFLSGISQRDWLAYRLRMGPDAFRLKLVPLRDHICGRNDGRVMGGTSAPGATEVYDPSAIVPFEFFARGIKLYMQHWKLNGPSEYVNQNSKTLHEWNLPNQNVLPILEKALLSNTSLRVFIASGLFDLAVPFFQTHLDVNGMSPLVLDRVCHRLFEAGHSIWFQEDSCKQEYSALIKFYQDCVPQNVRSTIGRRQHFEEGD